MQAKQTQTGKQTFRQTHIQTLRHVSEKKRRRQGANLLKIKGNFAYFSRKKSIFLVLINNLLGILLGNATIYTKRQKSCTTFSLDFFWIKIDGFKNQCSLVIMPVQKTIGVEKIKCV